MKYIDNIRNAIRENRVRFRYHAAEMMVERQITREDVFETLRKGTIIEEYATDKPFPSFLVHYYNGWKHLHVVCSYNDSDTMAIVITVYVPDLKHFESDFVTRRQKNE